MANDMFNADDRYQLDDGLDFDYDGLEMDPMAVKDDRTPVVKVAAGAKNAAKEYVRDPAKVMQFMRSAMPPGYGKAFDIGRESVEEIQSLYNNVRETTKPAVRAVKNLTGAALPLAKGILPKKVYDRIKDLTGEESEYSYQGRSEEEETSNRVESLLGEIFEAQKSLDEQRDQRAEFKDQLEEGVTQLRHKGQMEQLNQIRLAVQSLSSYQDRVLVNYQKRSLELQYRQYWTSAEALKDQKIANKTLLEQMQAVVKNTALPDYAKMNNKEAFLEQSRNKFVQDVRDSLFSSGSSYVRQFGENARKQVSGFLNNFVQGFQLADSIASPMLQGVGEDDDGMGGGMAEEMLGGGIADMGLDSVSTRLGNKARKHLQKNKKIDRMDAKIGYAANNIGSTVDDYLTNPEKNWGRMEFAREMLARMAPSPTTETKLELPLMKDMQKPRQFNGQDSKSLTEIIPGLLARIHREVRMIRTGEENAPLLMFDFEKNRFSDDQAIGQALRKRFGEGSRAGADIDNIIKQIDRSDSLTDEQRAMVRSVLVDRTLRKQDMSAKAMTASDTWGGGENGEAAAQMFARYLKTKDGKLANSRNAYKRANALQDSVRSSVSQVGDSFEYVQEMVNLGQYGALLNSGIVNERGEIDLDAMGRLIAGKGDTVTGIGDMGSLGQSGKSKKPKRSRQVGGNTVNIDKSRFQFDTSGLEKSIAQMNSQIGKMTPAAGTDNTRLQSIDETLLRIEQILEQTGQIEAAHYQHVGGDLENKAYTSLFSHIKDKAGAAVGAVGRHAKAVGGRVVGAGKRVAGLAGMVGSLTSKIAGPRLSRLGRKVSGFFNSDIFVGLEGKPRLLSSVLKAGGYIDAATGKVITSFKDIKGDIKDLQGNIVLRVSEFEDAYISGELRKKFTDLLGSAFSLARGMLDKVTNFVPNTIRSAFAMGRRAVNLVRSKLPPYDVYVTGDEEPTLYASFFRMGKYFSRKTKKPILHPREIEGEVVDDDNNVVLTNEQIKRGLVDVRGGKIGNIASRIFQRIKNPIANTLKTITDFGSGALKWVTGKVKDSAAFIKSLLTGRLDIGIYSKRTGDILEEIRDFMFETWGKKRKVAGDMDGDGIRDNSLEDMARKRKESGEEGKKKEEKDDEKKPGFLSRFMTSISSVFSKFGKKKKDEDDEDEDDDDGFSLSDAADIADIADSAGDANERRKGRKGKKGKGKARKPRARRGRLGRTAGKQAGKQLGKQAAKGGIRGAAASIAKKGVFSTFMPRMLGRLGIGAVGAGATAASGVLGAGSAIGTGLGMLGTAASALVSWPGLIAAGVLYGGYKIYKNMQETKLTPLSRVRLAQYGIPESEAEMVKKVFAFENMLQEKVKFDNQGWATVDRNDLEQKDLAELFGLKSAYQAKKFVNWYDSRFAPVFTRALSQMKQMKVEAPVLRNVESQIEANAKEKYMDAVVDACENYHGFMKGLPGFMNLTIDHAGVLQIANEQRIQLKRAEKNETGKTAEFKAPETTQQLASRTTAEKARLAAENPDDYEVKDKEGNVLKNLTRDEIAKAVKEGATIRAVIDVPKNVLLSDPNRLDALTCIRYKTYGLTSMMLDKVQSLMGLEALCMKYVTPSQEGATFTAKTDEILLQCATVFGKQNTTGKASEDWKLWFNERFLPTFLPFIGALNKLTSSTDYINAIKKLTPSQQLKMANMLTGSSGVDNNQVASSVWEVSNSPWIDYELGMNPDVVLNNLETIKALVAKIELQEPLTPEKGKNQSPAERNASQPNPDLTKPAIFTRGARAKGAVTSANSSAAAGMQATGDIITGTGEKMSRVGESMQISGGNGRKWGDLPNATGSGWSAMKDLIIEAARATGIDPQVLASYIAVESGFDPSAQPAGGRARGLGQHMPDTWKEMMTKYGASLGIPAGTGPTDPRAGALLTAMYLKQNVKFLQDRLKRDVSVAEGYLAHFAGPSGAANLLESPGSAIASEVRPAAARSNPNVFFDKNTKRPYTVKEMIEKLTEKLQKRPGEHGVSNKDFSGAGSGPVSATASAAPAQQAGTPIVAAADPAPSKIAPGGFANPQKAAEVSARPVPEKSANSANIDLGVKANLTPSGPPLGGNGKIELFLKREPSTDDGTFGILQFPDGTSLLSLELPWRNNKNGVSCIPAGTYKCAKRSTTNFGFSYEVKNVPGRSGILIHAGNSAGNSEMGKKADSAGCILLGQGRGQKGSQKIITSSKAAMKIFHDKLQDRDFTLTVTAAQGEEMSQSQSNDNPTRGNIEKIAASAPQSPASAISKPLGGGGPAASQAPTAAPAQESGTRAALAGLRAPNATAPTSSAPAPAFDRGFKPSSVEMAARDQGVLVEVAKANATTNELISKQIEGDIRRENLLKKLVELGETTQQKSGPDNRPAAASKVTPTVDVKPIDTGRKY